MNETVKVHGRRTSSDNLEGVAAIGMIHGSF
jgi:hypothetical protein